MKQLGPSLFRACISLLIVSAAGVGDGDEAETGAIGLIRSFCIDCHSSDGAEAGVNLEGLTADDTFASEFRTWQKVAVQLEQKQMPPRDAEQPTSAQRKQLISGIQSSIAAAANKQDGDPGHVVIRRLTSAEYGYAISDLLGFEFDVGRNFVSDAVGGAGFANTGIVQFTQDATLEQYLLTARRVADHAVVGSGPLTFFRDPGQTGFELSAINRIQKIYHRHGFRAGAGEGGEAFGLEKYPKAFFVAWQFRHRHALGAADATLASLADEAGIDARFAEHIFALLTEEKPPFPTAIVVREWRMLPAPIRPGGKDVEIARSKCDEIAQLLRDWQNRFGTNPDAKEEAPVLRADLFDAKRVQPFEMNVNWPKGTKSAHLVISIESANKNGTPDAVIVWKDAEIQFRDYAKQLEDPKPLRNFLAPKTIAQLKFGQHPRGGKVRPNEFVTEGTTPLAFELPIPDGARSARLLIMAELDLDHGEDCTVRCTIAQLEETDQGKSVSGLLTNPDNPAFDSWKAGVLEFARRLPQMSHREPAPSDRDPIPTPFDTTYNNAERNFFHTHIKYHRDDSFLVDKILDDDVRRQLDQAWADLLGSFEFHDTWLQFLAKKYGFAVAGRGIADLDDATITEASAPARDHLKVLKADYQHSQAMFRAAEPGHLQDVLRLAARAWRRPLLDSEADDLRSFYHTLREDSRLDHRSAICALIARVLVAPSFLYRAERVPGGQEVGSEDVVALSPWELASRLSFFLWSSVPDEELRRAATAGELDSPSQVAAQARRMLRDPKSRRFATEFFGQWFGFYRFDEFRGIDPDQFPEFSESLRQSMYDEAIEFFDYIVRHDRPMGEILFADYTFLNRQLAAHYDVDIDFSDASTFDRMEKASRVHRGGLLRLGAILATTSAPRRTSPVRRGNWILRRVLGTAVPPPPADAGSIPADEVVADGLSMSQRLEAHRRNVSCYNCHSRFDALGFALENYDPLGRWRQQYRDEKSVETAGTLRDGTEIAGDDSLHKYLASQQPQFHKTLAIKLLGYALGRRQSVGDLSLLEKLTGKMENGRGMWDLIECIVTSRQFRYHRVSDASAIPTEPQTQ